MPTMKKKKKLVSDIKKTGLEPRLRPKDEVERLNKEEKLNSQTYDLLLIKYRDILRKKKVEELRNDSNLLVNILNSDRNFYEDRFVKLNQLLVDNLTQCVQQAKVQENLFNNLYAQEISWVTEQFRLLDSKLQDVKNKYESDVELLTKYYGNMVLKLRANEIVESRAQMITTIKSEFSEDLFQLRKQCAIQEGILTFADEANLNAQEKHLLELKTMEFSETKEVRREFEHVSNAILVHQRNVHILRTKLPELNEVKQQLHNQLLRADLEKEPATEMQLVDETQQLPSQHLFSEIHTKLSGSFRERIVLDNGINNYNKIENKIFIFCGADPIRPTLSFQSRDQVRFQVEMLQQSIKNTNNYWSHRMKALSSSYNDKDKDVASKLELANDVLTRWKNCLELERKADVQHDYGSIVNQSVDLIKSADIGSISSSRLKSSSSYYRQRGLQHVVNEIRNVDDHCKVIADQLRFVLAHQ